MGFSRTRRQLAEALGTLVLLASTSASAVQISDGIFANADWTASILAASGPPTRFSATQILAGGDPGSYRQTQQTYGGPGDILTGHIFTGAQYAPSTEGAISQITYSFDLMLTDGGESGAVGYGLVILQNGTYYRQAGSTLTTIEPVRNVWVGHASSTLTTGDFSPILGIGAQPDFSTGGAPISFGYFASNGTADSQPTGTSSGIDNWSVTISAVPEPTSFAMLAAGLALLGFGSRLLPRRMKASALRPAA